MLDFDPGSFANGGCQTDFQIQFQGPQNLVQLPAEERLVGDFKQVGDVIALSIQDLCAVDQRLRKLNSGNADLVPVKS